jgi:hypothetical protein
MKIDFNQAKINAVKTLSQWCPGFTKAQKKGEEYFFPNPLRPENKNYDNFSINISKMLYKDFNSVGGQGDILQLYSKLNNCSDKDSALHFLETLEVHEPDYPPAKKGYSGKWYYQSPGCNFWVYRYDTEGKKTFSQWHKKDGEWINKKPEKPENGFPLYPLWKIKNYDKVVLVEGEKARDAISRTCEKMGLLAVCWAGGAQSWQGLDLSPLKGKEVLQWPDSDQGGIQCMNDISEKLKPIAKSIERVKIKEVTKKGKDGADYSPEEQEEILKDIEVVYKERDLFPLTKYGDLEIKGANWLIDPYFEDNAFISLFGPSGSYKSFLAIEIGICVASGLDFHGHKVKKTGPVIYIAGEGQAGITKRVKAWETANHKDIKDCPFFISSKPANLGNDDLMQHVENAVKAVAEQYGNIALIIVDTWARSLTGNENSQEDTQAAIRSLDDLRNKYQCSAVIVHHTGHENSDRGRGSSNLPAALDQEYKISLNKKSNIISFECKKMKDAEFSPSLFFNFIQVELDVKDDKGKNLTSGILRVNENFEDNQDKNLGKNELLALAILEENNGYMLKSTFHSTLDQSGMGKSSQYKLLDSLSGKCLIDIERMNGSSSDKSLQHIKLRAK